MFEISLLVLVPYLCLMRGTHALAHKGTAAPLAFVSLVLSVEELNAVAMLVQVLAGVIPQEDVGLCLFLNLAMLKGKLDISDKVTIPFRAYILLGHASMANFTHLNLHCTI